MAPHPACADRRRPTSHRAAAAAAAAGCLCLSGLQTRPGPWSSPWTGAFAAAGRPRQRLRILLRAAEAPPGASFGEADAVGSEDAGDVEDEDKYEKFERPKYSWSDSNRPKPVTMAGRAGTDVPRGFNPLLNLLEGLPDYEKIRPEHLVSGMQMTVNQFGSDLERYQISMNVSCARPWRLTWEKFAEPLEHLLDRVDRIWSAVGLLRDVNGTSPAVHKAYNDLVPLLSGISVILAQSDDIYEAMRLLTFNPRLTEAQRRVIDKYMLQSWHSGIGLQDPVTSRQITETFKELTYLGALFATNVAQGEEQVMRLAQSAEEVSGLPHAVRETAAQAARDQGNARATAAAGPWLLRVRDSKQVLEHCEDRDLRREAYEAAAKLAWREGADGQPGDNSWVVSRMLELRHQWATNIGYSSYADMAFDNRMATVKQVDLLLASLQNASLAAAREELGELRALAQAQGHTEELKPWDLPFWAARLQRERLQMTEEDLQPYLPLTAVLGGLFELLQRLFGLEMLPADGQVPVWAEDVRFHRVTVARTKVPLGGLFLDLHAAPRKRRAGFWAERTMGYSRLLGRRDDPRRPVVHVVGDVQEAEDEEGSPALMTWSQVLGLFRAMGLALQELLTDQSEGILAGRRGTEYDAVAFPQHFMELWAYDPRTLKAMCQHHQTGEAPPQELLDAVISSQRLNAGLRLLDDLAPARLDLELHAHFDPAGKETPLQMAAQLEKELAPLPAAADGRRLCCMLGPFATGQAAGQYAELWARVLAADAFEAFEEAADDDGEVQRLGDQFRVSILGPGGGRAPLEAFKDFRGRIPRVAPLLRRLGLKRG